MHFVAIFNADASSLKSVDLGDLSAQVRTAFEAAGHSVQVELPEGKVLKVAIEAALADYAEEYGPDA